MDRIRDLKNCIENSSMTNEEKGKYWDGLVRRMKGKIAESIYLMSTEENRKRLDKISTNFDIWEFARVIDDELETYDFSTDLKIILQKFFAEEIKNL